MAALAPSASAEANSLFEYFGPRVVSVGEVGRADARDSASTTLNPAGLALSRTVVFEGSYGYQPGDSLSLVNINACDSTVAVAGCFYYRFLDASPELSTGTFDRRVHEFGANLARALSEQILIGVNLRYFDYDSELVDEGDDSGFTVDAGAVVRPTERIQLGVVGYNLIPQDTPQYPTAVGGGITVRPLPTLAIGADGVWDLDDDLDQGSGRYGVGTEYFFASSDQQSGFPVRAGYVYDNQLGGSFVSGGLGWLNSKFGLDIAVRRQVDGGDELMLQAGLRLFGPAVR